MYHCPAAGSTVLRYGTVTGGMQLYRRDDRTSLLMVRASIRVAGTQAVRPEQDTLQVLEYRTSTTYSTSTSTVVIFHLVRTEYQYGTDLETYNKE